MEPRFKFEQLNEGDSVEFGFSTVSWPTVADHFFDFLLGCGYGLDRQDLSDHFDQTVFRQQDEKREAENHAEQFGMQANEEDALIVKGPDQSVPRLLGKKLYEFTVTDQFGKGIARAWHTAREVTQEQINFEIQCGGEGWPPHRLFMIDAGEQDGAMVYNFEVQRA